MNLLFLKVHMNCPIINIVSDHSTDNFSSSTEILHFFVQTWIFRMCVSIGISFYFAYTVRAFNVAIRRMDSARLLVASRIQNYSHFSNIRTETRVTVYPEKSFEVEKLFMRTVRRHFIGTLRVVCVVSMYQKYWL